jgi:hypothetical protein
LRPDLPSRPDQPPPQTDVIMAKGPYREFWVLLYAAARLSIWLAVLAAVFVPIERMFALHSQKILRKGIAVDLGYYFLTGLLPGLVLAAPISLAVLGIHNFIPGGVLGEIAAWPIWLRHDDGRRDRLLLGASFKPPDSVSLAVSRRASQRGTARFSSQHPDAAR